MTRDTDELQRADEEAKLARCVELYEQIESGGFLSIGDLKDLQYFLGIEVSADQKRTWRLR